jgi:uncharacterized protein YceK
MLHTHRFFSSKCRLFHNATFFGSCIIHILHTGCAKIKKQNSGAKGLTDQRAGINAYKRKNATQIYKTIKSHIYENTYYSKIK